MTKSQGHVLSTKYCKLESLKISIISKKKMAGDKSREKKVT